VPFNNPIPDSKPPRGKLASGVGALVQAEKAVQIALLLPSAVGIGWLLGAWADSRFHQSWIGIAGVIFGAISGLVGVIRMVIDFEKDSHLGSKAENGNDSAKGGHSS
jgi:hypothetical protein